MAPRIFRRTLHSDPVSIKGKLIVAPTVAYGCVITELTPSEAHVELNEDQDLPHRVMLFEGQQRRIWECAVHAKTGRSVSLNFIDACTHAARRELMETPELGLLEEDETPSEPAPQPQGAS